MRGRADAHLALGIVTPEDAAALGKAIPPVRRGSSRALPRWRRWGDDTSGGESAPVVISTRCRTVIHPAPALSPLWGNLRVGDEVGLINGDELAGPGTVAWIRPVGPGLAEGQLSALVAWAAGGKEPDV